MITKFKVNEEGFTLVELLATIIVLLATSAVIGGIITSSLRGANKTTVIENIRQNGNYALAQVSKSIEYAQVFNGLSDKDKDYVASCFYVSPTPAPPVNFIKVTPLKSNPIIYNCNSSAFTSDGISLVDTDLLSLTECSISCTQSSITDVPVIKIRFKLGPKNQSSLSENSTPPVLFETSVTVRNYKR